MLFTGTTVDFTFLSHRRTSLSSEPQHNLYRRVYHLQTGGKKSSRLDTTTAYSGDLPEIVVLCNLTRAPLSVQKHRVQKWLQL
ncbi:hypothetical protein Bca4012_058549 [Brassica carinata]